jgi:hypothetical protein
MAMAMAVDCEFSEDLSHLHSMRQFAKMARVLYAEASVL